jgi:hypothetical protein
MQDAQVNLLFEPESGDDLDDADVAQLREQIHILS